VADVSFPVLQARTARFTLGRPRTFAVGPDGSRVAFLRSRGGTDRATCLWVYDVDDRAERLVADPLALQPVADGSAGGAEATDAAEGALPASERFRRERAREQAGGIVAYATDAALSLAAFALSGRLFVADLVGGSARPVDVDGPVFDPRPDPTGRRVAYACAAGLRIVELADGRDGELVSEAGVSWGVAEFVAAEEMNRRRGFWWAPDGKSLIVAKVDEAGVRHLHIGDPAHPDRSPHTIAYPFAGTSNAKVSLWVVSLDGSRVEIRWDVEAFPYVVAVRWRDGHRPLLQVCSRDQRAMRVLDVDITNGVTNVVREDRDDHWLEVVGGVPDRLRDGRLVYTVDDHDTRRLVVGDHVVTPPGLQVRAVLAVGETDIVFSASTEPTETQVWGVFAPGDECVALTVEPGVHTATGASDVLVVTSTSLAQGGARSVVRKNGVEIAEILSAAEPAPFTPNISISREGDRALRTALLLPRDHVAGSRRLPVLMDPYGGPHAQRVVASQPAYFNAQWLADQGFAVVIVDGRGTPGRGPTWEREIAGDLAGPVLDDQIDALHAIAETYRDLDITKVAIRGWSFGGYLAALAVLRRPDVFHAAVAGAPVTDWRLYDTFYTERYLGVDASSPAYDDSSLIADAPALTRPLLLVHGLADDNVVAAHTLRLSTALLAAGRAHQVLPLSGVTHMASHETVAANLLNLEVAFLRSSLGIS